MNPEIQCSQDENSLPRQSALWPADVNLWIRGVRYVFGLSPHASQFADAGGELHRVLFGENLPHFAMLAIRAALGLVKDLQRSFYWAQRANPALCFEFLACRRRRFRVPWLPSPLAETSEGFLYL